MSDAEQHSTISDQLRKVIEESGISLNKLGKETGIDHSRLSRFMRGERGLTTHALDRLSEALGFRLVQSATEDIGPAKPETVQEKEQLSETLPATQEESER